MGKTPVYELRKGKQTYVRSSAPDCGYTKEQLRSLKAAGYRLFVDGKLKR